jgi:hypothetical protein
MAMSSSPLRDFGKVTAKDALNLMGAPEFVCGKSTVSDELLFVRTTRNRVTAGADGAGVTVTTTIELELDVSQAVPQSAARRPKTTFALFIGKLPACPGWC